MPDATAPVLAAERSAESLLMRLEWRVLKVLDGLLQGDYRTLMRGAGMDLADLREYQTHDDVRHIDWNVTARLDTPHVRVFTEDREMSAWFLLDASPSVNFGPPGRTKRDQLICFTAVLARLLTRRGNRVGAVLHGLQGGASAAAKDLVLPAKSTRTHVLRMLHLLMAQGKTPPKHTAPRPGTTQLQHLLALAQQSIARRASVFVVSDFMSEPGWEKPLARLAQRHDVVAVRLLDPLELALPNIGLVWLRDAETGERLHVDTRSAGFRRRYARLAAERESQLRDSLARAGVDTLELSTDDDLLDSMVRFMEMRGVRLRGQRPAARTA